MGHPSGSAARARFSAAPVSSAWLAKSGQKPLVRQIDGSGSWRKVHRPAPCACATDGAINRQENRSEAAYHEAMATRDMRTILPRKHTESRDRNISSNAWST